MFSYWKSSSLCCSPWQSMKLWSNQWVHAWKEDEECFRCVQMRSKVRFRQSLAVGSRSDIALLHCMRYHAAIIVVIWAFALRKQRCWFCEAPPNVWYIRNERPILISVRETTRAVPICSTWLRSPYGHQFAAIYLLIRHAWVLLSIMAGDFIRANWRRSQKALPAWSFFHYRTGCGECLFPPNSNSFGLCSCRLSCGRTNSRDGLSLEVPSCLKYAWGHGRCSNLSRTCTFESSFVC